MISPRILILNIGAEYNEKPVKPLIIDKKSPGQKMVSHHHIDGTK